MFADRLSEIMDEIDATSREISTYAGFDESTLSRLRRGSRVPKQDSPTIKKMVNGLYMYAADNSCLDKLYKIIEAHPGSEESIKEQITDWLFEGTDESADLDANNEKPKSHRVYVTAFRDNLNAVMDMTGTSNSNLSRALHIDPSAVSRYRSGYKIPDKDPELTKRLSDYLFEKIKSADKLDELSSMMGLYDEHADRKKFYKWLCNYEDRTLLYMRSLEQFLGAFEAIPGGKSDQLLTMQEAVPKEILDDDSVIYVGQSGLQAAVLRFLGQAIKSGAKEFLLYSDQRMDWMSSSEDFRLRWASLMYECVRHGIHIRIIHNINRGLDEMNQAIISWLPLYMTGMIEPYYCQKTDQGNFAHTIFLCPGKMCISSFCTRGAEEDAVICYMQDKRVLDSNYCSFNTLLQKSKILMKVMSYESEDPSRTLYDSGVSLDTEIISVESPNKRVKIMIGGDKVFVFRLSAPYICITMDHPLMYRAFMSYAKSLEI